MVSGHLQQMGTNRIQAVIARQAVIGLDRFEQFEAGGWTVYHSRANGVIEHHHGIRGHALQQIVRRQDLRAISLLHSGRFIMNGGDAACNWYAPIEPFESAAVSGTVPSAISLRSHRVRSC